MYRDALRGWDELGLPWDRALSAIDMATVLDPTEAEVVAAVDQARATFERLVGGTTDPAQRARNRPAR